MRYQNDPTWQALQPYLPEHNRLTTETAPDEYFLKVPGYRLHLDHYRCPAPKARLILFHGVGGNGRLLSFIALPLQRAGYELICPDLPLYGYTEYSGPVSYADWVDVGAQVVAQFRDDVLPTVVFGLSAGGLLAYQVACRCPEVRGIIATCILDQRDREITRATAVTPWLGRLAPPLLTFWHKRLPNLQLPMKAIANMRAIANDSRVAELLMQDRKSSGARVSVQFLYSLLHPQIETEPESFHSCPFLLLHPEQDRWTDIALSRRFFDKLACEKQLHILAGAGHFPLEPEGLQQLEAHCLSFLEQVCQR